MKLSKEHNDILQQARDTYGPRNQLAVAAEECNELAIAVLKFMRYDKSEEGIKNTRDNVLEERADIEIVLNHIDNLYGLTEEEIQEAIAGKLARLKRWMSKTSNLAYSMEDRQVGEIQDDCKGCFYFEHPEEAFETKSCDNCPKKQ